MNACPDEFHSIRDVEDRRDHAVEVVVELALGDVLPMTAVAAPFSRFAARDICLGRPSYQWTVEPCQTSPKRRNHPGPPNACRQMSAASVPPD